VIKGNKLYNDDTVTDVRTFVIFSEESKYGSIVIENNSARFEGEYDRRFVEVGSNVTIDRLVIKNNYAEGVKSGYQLVCLGTVNKWVQQGNYFVRNDGYPLYDENSGVATIPAGSTSVTVSYYSNTGQYCYYTKPRVFIAMAEDGTPVKTSINNPVNGTISVDTAPSADLKVYWIMRV